MFREILNVFLNRNKFASATKRAGKQRNIAWEQNFRNNDCRARGRLVGKFLSVIYICVMWKKLSRAAMMEARATLCNSSQVRSLVLFRGIALLNGHAI